MGCTVYSSHSLWTTTAVSIADEEMVYILTSYVGLSALLVSTIWAMREPLLRGTSDRTGSTFPYLYVATILTISQWQPWEHTEKLYE